MFYVWNNGFVNEYDTLKEAVQAADAEATYTQQPIKIYGGKYWQTWVDVADNKPIVSRAWCPVAYNPEEDDCSQSSIIDFGAFGHYGAWWDESQFYEEEEYMLLKLGEKYESYEAKKVGGWADADDEEV